MPVSIDATPETRAVIAARLSNRLMVTAAEAVASALQPLVEALTHLLAVLTGVRPVVPDRFGVRVTAEEIRRGFRVGLVERVLVRRAVCDVVAQLWIHVSVEHVGDECLCG